jgi:hypothetical protein
MFWKELGACLLIEEHGYCCMDTTPHTHRSHTNILMHPRPLSRIYPPPPPNLLAVSWVDSHVAREASLVRFQRSQAARIQYSHPRAARSPICMGGAFIFYIHCIHVTVIIVLVTSN